MCLAFFIGNGYSTGFTAHMQEMLELFTKGVADGAVVGRGHNLVETLSDPTAHAEMQALTAAASTLGGKYLQGCTLYVTVEPCIMCAGAIGWAQVGRVVWGADDPKKGYRRYSEAVFHPKTTVVRGILGGECGALMTSFFAGLRD